MDKAGHYYVWFLLVITALAAAVKLIAPRQYATIESDKLAEPRTRRRRLWMGAAVALLSPLILLYGLWGPLRAWMWLSVVVGVLSGAEQISAARFHEPHRMLWHTRVFGAISAAVTVGIYLFLLRK